VAQILLLSAISFGFPSFFSLKRSQSDRKPSEERRNRISVPQPRNKNARAAWASRLFAIAPIPALLDEVAAFAISAGRFDFCCLAAAVVILVSGLFPPEQRPQERSPCYIYFYNAHDRLIRHFDMVITRAAHFSTIAHASFCTRPDAALL
jgi:hypothetical protein